LHPFCCYGNFYDDHKFFFSQRSLYWKTFPFSPFLACLFIGGGLPQGREGIKNFSLSQKKEKKIQKKLYRRNVLRKPQK
jgi:hypothetical protein